LNDSRRPPDRNSDGLLLHPPELVLPVGFLIISRKESWCNMDYKELYDEMKKIKEDYSSKLDVSLKNNANANKRLFIIILALIAMCTIIGSVYFLADYEIYPDMNQQQMIGTNNLQQQQN
jgi:hypothetical protein